MVAIQEGWKESVNIFDFFIPIATSKVTTSKQATFQDNYKAHQNTISPTAF